MNHTTIDVFVICFLSKMDKNIHVFIKALMIYISLSVAKAQCPVDFHCPFGQICAMARQDYGPAIPECISTSGTDAALLDQAVHGGPAGPGTGTDRLSLNHYVGSQYHPGSFGHQSRGFQDPYAANIWDPMARGSRYPVRRHMYPFSFRRPFSMYGGYISPDVPRYQSGYLGLRPNVFKDRSEPIQINVTVDNNNNNVLEQNGSSNVRVNQIAEQSVTPTPPVNHNGPVITLHPGPLVPVQIPDIHDPWNHPEMTMPVVDPTPVNQNNLGIPLHPGQLVPVKIHDIHDPGHQPDIVSPAADLPSHGHGNQGIPLGVAKPRVV